MAGIGIILKDPHSEVLFVASIKEEDIQEPETIETVAVLYGLQLSMHL